MEHKDLKEALRKFFGFDSFKGHQESIITNVLNKQNTFVIMPTGGGKSLCYQLPALLLGRYGYRCFPANRLDEKPGGCHPECERSRIPIAHFLNSSLSKTEINRVKEDILAGQYQIALCGSRIIDQTGEH